VRVAILGIIMAIDTEQHGVPRDQARAHAAAVNQFLFPQLATKPDLTLAIAELKSDLTVRVLVIIGLMNGLLFGLIKLT
jgi:hypothetical protein